MPSTDHLATQLDRLAAFDTGPFPVLSLYLNLQPDQHGRDHVDPFLRKELEERVRTYPPESPERESLEADAERVRTHVSSVPASVNGLAVFACSAAGLFEAVELSAPITEHQLFVGSSPQVYPLVRLADDYPRYAVVVADTNLARIFIVAANRVESRETVENTKTRGHKMGGWSQKRYQRRIGNEHARHAREVVEALQRLVIDEGVSAVIIAGDEVVVPLLRAEMPKAVAEKLVDVLRLDIRAPEHDIIAAAHELMQQKDADSDRERVEALFDAYRSRGLGVVGAEATTRALEMGQVDELLISDAPERDALIAKAAQTAARITVVQDAALLAPVGGVGALLRFTL